MVAEEFDQALLIIENVLEAEPDYGDALKGPNSAKAGQHFAGQKGYPYLAARV